MRQLRPRQTEVIAAVLANYLKGITTQVVQLPTGMGKTVIFSELPNALPLGNDRMLVIVHREELATQTAASLQEWNPDRTVGVEMGELRAGDAQLVVAGVQTLNVNAARLQSLRPGRFSLLVTDECHHATAPSYGKVFEHFGAGIRRDLLHVGFTATTNRADGKGLNKHYETIAYSMTLYDAIKQGWLANLRAQRIVTATSLDSVASTAGDLQADQLEQAVNTEYRNQVIRKGYMEHGEDRKFIGFTAGISHAQLLAKLFNEAGIRTEAIWGSDPERAEKLAAHKAGDLKGLFNCQILTEGYDDWSVRAIILARPTQSTALLTQMLGRGTRIPPGVENLLVAARDGVELPKTDCLVLEVADILGRHRLATFPTLFGFGQQTDLKGQSVTAFMPAVEELLEQKPYLDFSQLPSLDELQTYAHQIELFEETSVPELDGLSQYNWHKSGEGAYVLSLPGSDYLFVVQDYLGNYTVHGKLRQYSVCSSTKELASAIDEADYYVNLCGGNRYRYHSNKKQTRDEQSPSEMLKQMARDRNLVIPPGTTHGQLRRVLSRLIAEEKWVERYGK